MRLLTPQRVGIGAEPWNRVVSQLRTTQLREAIRPRMMRRTVAMAASAIPLASPVVPKRCGVASRKLEKQLLCHFPVSDEKPWILLARRPLGKAWWSVSSLPVRLRQSPLGAPARSRVLSPAPRGKRSVVAVLVGCAGGVAVFAAVRVSARGRARDVCRFCRNASCGVPVRPPRLPFLPRFASWSELLVEGDCRFCRRVVFGNGDEGCRDGRFCRNAVVCASPVACGSGHAGGSSPLAHRSKTGMRASVARSGAGGKPTKGDRSAFVATSRDRKGEDTIRCDH